MCAKGEGGFAKYCTSSVLSVLLCVSSSVLSCGDATV
jgi:hypothetical protein